MQPLTFPCPKCAKRIGVGLELAGKSVRCPHCREVVVAPSPATPAAVAPDLLLRAASQEGAESILGEAEEAEDSLFVEEAPRKLVVPPPAPQANLEGRPNPHVTPAPTPERFDAVLSPSEVNPFEIAPGPTAAMPRRSTRSPSKPKDWKKIGIYLLVGYAALMTILAAWGWMRSPTSNANPSSVRSGQ